MANNPGFCFMPPRTHLQTQKNENQLLGECNFENLG